MREERTSHTHTRTERERETLGIGISFQDSALDRRSLDAISASNARSCCLTRCCCSFLSHSLLQTSFSRFLFLPLCRSKRCCRSEVCVSSGGIVPSSLSPAATVTSHSLSSLSLSHSTASLPREPDVQFCTPSSAFEAPFHASCLSFSLTLLSSAALAEARDEAFPANR